MNIHPMHKKTVTTAIVLEKRVLRKNKQYPVKLRVTFDRKQKFYSIRYVPEKIGEDFTDYQKYWIRKTDKSISMSEMEYKKVQKDNPMEPFKTMKLYLQAQELFAQEAIQKLKPFSFEEFENKFFSKTIDDQDVFAALKAKAEHLQREGKISTATIYKSTLQSLKSFTGKGKYPFSKVTVAFLQEYEQWMLSRTIVNKSKPKEEPRHLSRTTISMYLRALKAVFNESAPEGTPYPFGKKKYVIPGWNHNKRALKQEEVANIADYPVVDGTMEHRSRDLWLFSFLCNGINFRDIANLRYSNIREDTITFERAKTAQKGGNDNEIIVIITKRIGKIIDRWGTGSGYIFGILKDGMTAQEQHRAIAQMVKTTNKYMERICTSLKIPATTSYGARHSFASVLKRSGASIEFISESLGHKNIKTTMDYLSSFEIKEKAKWAEMLLPEK